MEALALLCAGAAGGALFALLREFDIGDQLALSLAVGLTVSPPLLVVFLRNGREVDSAAILVLMLGAYFIVRRRLAPLAVTLLAGATGLTSLSVPRRSRTPCGPSGRWTGAQRDVLVVSVLPIIGYVYYLRASIVAVGEQYQPGYEGPFLTERIDVLKAALAHGSWHREIAAYGAQLCGWPRRSPCCACASPAADWSWSCCAGER